MLTGMRKAGQSRIGKIVMAVLFGFLILSFAVWGIGDMLRSAGHLNVATVGSREIGAQAFRDAYQNELQSLSRRARRSVTAEEARAYGVPQQVLSRMLTEATLDQDAKDLGLAISDKTIAAAILTDPNFQGANGQFDRNRFNDLIRQNGFTEQGFVATQRGVYLRQQIAQTVGGEMPVPTALRDAVNRFQNETRSAEFIVLGPALAGEVAAPDQATLQKFFDERKASFRAPDYRKVAVMALRPADVAKADAVSDADARALYERTKQRFGQPERRSVQQIVFPTLDEAKAAAERIKAGATFDAIVEERKLGKADVDLGLVTKDAIIDPAVADAAFSLPANGVSDPLQGRFGAVIVRVGEVQPESVKPFEEVAATLKQELATSRAKDAVQDLHDKIEDQRASAKPLADIAREQNLTVQQFAGIDRAGRDKAEKLVELPERDALLKAIFASDIGVDNESIASKDGGFVWFEVQGIEPSRERTLDEVKGEVEAQWKEEQLSGRLADKAQALVKDLRGGKALADVAKDLGVDVKTAAGVKRQGADGGLPASAVAQLFSTPVGGFASALGANPQERIVLKVAGADVPPLLSTTSQAQKLDEQLGLALGDDVLSAYVSKLQAQLGVTINQAVLSQAIGGQ
ncbi:MAG: SurA N-terminal domain-containing protein [Alsobacter sp.]